jgi:predicted Zn-dependent protease
MRQGADLALPLALLDMHRKQEIAADRRAVNAMAAEGYDPAALSRYVERELARFDSRGGNQAFSPLPPVAQRLDAINSAIAELPAQLYAAHPGLLRIQEELRRR